MWLQFRDVVSPHRHNNNNNNKQLTDSSYSSTQYGETDLEKWCVKVTEKNAQDRRHFRHTRMLQYGFEDLLI
jgi:hypothetical protein